MTEPAPSAANRRAKARPIPLAPPVTTMTASLICMRAIVGRPTPSLGLGRPDQRLTVIARDYGDQEHQSYVTRRSHRMTEAIDGAQLDEALAVVDRGLSEMMRRDLVATSEVADLLLDLRSILTFVPADPSAEPAGVN